MSAIAGIWRSEGAPVERGHLEAMAGALSHRGEAPCRMWVSAGAGLLAWSFPDAVIQPAGTEPYADASGRRYLLDGRLDDREALARRIGSSDPVTGATPDESLLASAYGEWGADLPEKLDGDFAFAVWDPGQMRLLLARDAVGVRPLYWTRVAGGLLFASEIKALLAVPGVRAVPDADELARHLVGQSREATDHSTFFAGIRRLGPAQRLIADRAGIRTETWWDFDRVRPIRYRDPDAYVEDFRERFERAVCRRMRSPSPVVVSLSGGLDSSSVYGQALALQRAGRADTPGLFAVSYVSDAGTPSDEAAYLAAVERFHGTTAERVPVRTSGLLQGAEAAVRQLESPFLDEMWETTQATHSAMRAGGARVMLTGLWADQLLFDTAYLVDLVRRGSVRRVRAHFREYRRWWPEETIAGFRRRLVTDLIKYSVPPGLFTRRRNLRVRAGRAWFSDAFKARLRNTASQPTPLSVRLSTAHARSLHEQIRSGHHQTGLEWDAKIAAYRGMEMAFPFLDRDLLAFLVAIPGDASMQGGVPKAILREAMKDHLPPELQMRDNKADFTYQVNANVARDLERLGSWLGDRPRIVEAGWVDPGRLREALDGLRSRLAGREATAAWEVSSLMGLELWLRVFIP